MTLVAHELEAEGLELAMPRIETSQITATFVPLFKNLPSIYQAILLYQQQEMWVQLVQIAAQTPALENPLMHHMHR
ncbi:hypothetical protein HMI56_002696 [Coelomomyces lativittatus]|nr:hypothetical protein HMI56_002696 [Coelomomyces lativittatus]